MTNLYLFLSLLTVIFLKQNKMTHVPSNFKKMNNYSVTIDIFRKGNYKVYSLRLMNKEFEAIKYSAGNSKSPDTLYKKTLSDEEVSDIENIISALSLVNLQDEYINSSIRGEYHLIYHITKDEKQKEICVYYEYQAELKLLYEKLISLVPKESRFKYYR